MLMIDEAGEGKEPGGGGIPFESDGDARRLA